MSDVRKEYLKIRLAGFMQAYEKEILEGNYISTEYIPSKRSISKICLRALGHLNEDDIDILLTETHMYFSPSESRMGKIISLEEYEYDDFDDDYVEITHREYINDASFVFYIEADKEILDVLADALSCPARIIYLGHMDCIPSAYMNEGFVIPDEKLELVEWN